jgi:hypothetical protein
MDMERVIAHGHLRATVKDYWERRERALHPRPTATGQVNVAGWQKLAAIWKGTIQRGGERLVGEVA